MTPKIIKQKKLLIGSGNNNGQADFSRLQAGQTMISQGAELEDWNDDEDSPAAGWDELDDESTKNLIREKRRELRAQRQQQMQKQKKPHANAAFAERVSFARHS